jgi:3-hydroxyanthranilic acid dioxygenase
MSVQTLERLDPAATVRLERVAPPQTVFEAEPEKFRANFNKASFPFSHHLAGHPLFELPALLELSKSLREGDIYYDSGEIKVVQRWDEVPRTRLSVDQLIDRIENAGAWILLKRTNRDPRYAAILDQAFAEAGAMIGPAFPKKMKMRSAVVLVTSPNRISSYHIDPDANFLCQIHGEKVLHVFDRFDRENLPEEELERFWAFDKNAAIYKEKFQNRAFSYDLKPGVGVHMPLNAPHWVKNGNNISVTLAMIFQFPESIIGNVYRCNHYLRKLGLRPKPPGHSKLGDRMKALAMGGAIGARNAVKKVLGRSQ